MASSKRERIQLAVIAGLLLVTLAMAYKFILAGSTTPAADGRAAILLEPGQRDFVLREMRGFLVGLQQIDDALAREDMPAVAKASRSLGAGKVHDVPAGLLGKLPLEFKKLAFGVHSDFDAIADEAERNGGPKRTLAQLSAVLQKCTACHESYRFGEAGPQ